MLSPKIGVTVTVYSPSDGNTCVHEHAAAGAERQSFDVVVLRRVFRRAVDDQRRRRRLADRQAADLPRRRHVGLDQRRRDAERAGDVVEAVRRVVVRQVLRRVDVEIEQVADRRWRIRCGSGDAVPGGGVYGAAVAIELVLEPRDHRLVGRRLRPRARRPAASCPRASCGRPAPSVSACGWTLARSRLSSVSLRAESMPAALAFRCGSRRSSD